MAIACDEGAVWQLAQSPNLLCRHLKDWSPTFTTFLALFVFYCLRWIWSVMMPYKKLRSNWSRIFFSQQLHTHEVWIYHKVQVKYEHIWIGKGTFLYQFCWQTTVWELVCYWAWPLLWNSQVSCGQMGPALLCQESFVSRFGEFSFISVYVFNW